MRAPRSSPLRLAALAALALLAACGARTESSPVSLASFAERTLVFALTDVHSLEREVATGSHRFTLTFSSSNGPCQSLEGEVTASFNGQPMQLDPGGFPDSGGGRTSCQLPRAWFDFDPERWAAEPVEDIRIRLEDSGQASGHSMLLILHKAKARRRFVLAGIDTRDRFPRGQDYAFTWTPDSDSLLGRAQASLFNPTNASTSSLSVNQQGLTSYVHLPVGTPTTDYILRLGAYVAGQVATCEGVAACEGALFHSEERALSVTP